MINEKTKDNSIDYIKILNSRFEKEKRKKKYNNLMKITICVVAGIGSVMVIGTLCYCILMSNISLESILSTLLAFFSIFISIFFYFKADETSTKFYDSSYEFMKDISVTLGKIEERFGEKLNNLNEKVSHLDNVSNETNEEIVTKQDAKDEIINDLLNKANLNEEQKKKYRENLKLKEFEIEVLKKKQYRAEEEAERLRQEIASRNEAEVLFSNVTPLPPRRVLEKLLLTKDTSMFSKNAIENFRRRGIIDKNGKINEYQIKALLEGMKEY